MKASCKNDLSHSPLATRRPIAPTGPATQREYMTSPCSQRDIPRGHDHGRRSRGGQGGNPMGTRRQTKAGTNRGNIQQQMRQFAATYAREMDSVAEELGLTRTQAVLLGTASEPGSIRELAERI